MNTLPIALAILLLLVSGCTTVSDRQAFADFKAETKNAQDNWLATKGVKREELIGMSFDDVRKKLGEPHRNIDKNIQGCKECGPDLVRKCAFYCKDNNALWEYRPYRNIFGFKFLLMQVTFVDGVVTELY